MNRKPELIIHIGTHKTGTSSLQHYLKTHQDELRLMDNMNFIEFEIQKKYDIPLATKYDEEIVNEIKSYLSDNIEREKRNIISHEGFSGNPLTFYSNHKISAKMLFDATSDYERKIVVFFRRQDQFIQSSFMQYKQRGRKFNFSEFYDRKKIQHLNWLSKAEFYADFFGEQQLEVHLYDPKQFTKKSLINIFGKIIGSNVMAKDDNNVTENIGLSNEGLEVFEEVSAGLDTKGRDFLGTILQTKFNKGFGTNYDILDDKEALHVYNYFLESNRKLADTYSVGECFSGFHDTYGPKQTFEKYQIYKQLLVDLMKGGDPTRKESTLKLYLHLYKSVIRRMIKTNFKKN